MSRIVGPFLGALGNATTDLIGLWGATATSQPASSSQAAVTTQTISTITLSSTTVTTGAAFLTSTAQIAALVVAVNDAVTRAAALTILVNQLRLDLISSGNIKGSA